MGIVDSLRNEVIEMNQAIKDATGLDLLQGLSGWVSERKAIVLDNIKKFKVMITDIEAWFVERKNIIMSNIEGAKDIINKVIDFFSLRDVADFLFPTGTEDENKERNRLMIGDIFDKIFSHLEEIPNMVAKLVEALRKKFADIPLIGDLFKTEEESKQSQLKDAENEVIAAKKDFDRQQSKSAFLDPMGMEKERAAKRLENALAQWEILQQNSVAKVPATNENAVKKMEAIRDEGDEIEEKIAMKRSKQPAPAIVNTSNTTINRSETVALIGTDTDNKDKTINGIVHRDFLLGF